MDVRGTHTTNLQVSARNSSSCSRAVCRDRRHWSTSTDLFPGRGSVGHAGASPAIPCRNLLIVVPRRRVPLLTVWLGIHPSSGARFELSPKPWLLRFRVDLRYSHDAGVVADFCLATIANAVHRSRASYSDSRFRLRVISSPVYKFALPVGPPQNDNPILTRHTVGIRTVGIRPNHHQNRLSSRRY